ncbi:hypothetical protein AAE478_005914 [Parahypoxylon ruwenzoriense]
MAPTSKSSVLSSSKGAATNGNPAPDFAVNMNRIQMQLEARLKAARSFLPSRSDGGTPNSGGRSFSALNATSSSATAPSRSQLQSRDARAAARAAEEAEFAEERGLDPNAGIGLIRTPANSAADGSGKDRDTARLRGRLLGKRGRGSGGDGQKWVRREDSSDEEAGRSGLGRAKKNGKRSRAEMEADGRERREDSDHTKVNLSPEPTNEMPEMEGVDEASGAENSTFPCAGEEPGQPVGEESSKKKRKKKKKKKPKDKINND